MRAVDRAGNVISPDDCRHLSQVSSSSIASYLDCRQAWQYRYRDGLVALGRVAPPLVLGTLIHEALANVLHAAPASVSPLGCHAAVRLACDKLAEQGQYSGVDFDGLREQVTNALLYHVPRMQLDQWETIDVHGVPAIELSLGLDIGDGILCTGRIDWVARSLRTGKVYLIDHKTSSTESLGPPFVEHDVQLVIYRRLLAAHGVQIHGSLHHQIATAAPKAPARNKDGTIAARKIRSDWATVSAAIAKAGGDPLAERYDTLREHVERQVFRRWAPDLTTPVADDRLWRDVQEVALVMNMPSPVYRNRRAWACARCDMRAWCDADLQGLDRSSLLGVHYHSDDPPGEWPAVHGNALEIETQRSAHVGAYFVGDFQP